MWRLTGLRLTPAGQEQTLDLVRPEANVVDLRLKTSSAGEAKTTFKAGEEAVLLSSPRPVCRPAPPWSRTGRS